MCQGCYEKAGKPSIVNVKTVVAAACIDQVYEFSSSGGNLHIVIDDWNVEDAHLAHCLERIIKDDLSNGAERYLAEMVCYNSLVDLTVEERYSALAIHEGYLDPAASDEIQLAE